MGLVFYICCYMVSYLGGGLIGSPDWDDDQMEGQAPKGTQQP
jgi:hypothetical protein